MPEQSRQPNELQPRPEREPAQPMAQPWWTQPVVKVLLWSIAISVGVFALIAVLTLITAFSTMNDSTFDVLTHMDALSAAGVFGRGADAGMIKSLTAVTDALKANMLGFVGATIVLVVLALAAAHIVGDQRAQERTARLVQGVLMLVAASGFVA